MSNAPSWGLNAARVYGVEQTAQLTPVPADFKDRLGQLKAEYRKQGPQPSHPYYGWIRTRA